MTRISFALLTALSLCGLAGICQAEQSSDWWLSTEMIYAKPFRSVGYSGQKDDGIGTQTRLEYRLQPWMSVGLGYAEAKIDQQSDSSNFGFMDGSLRFLYPGNYGIQPYVLLGVGSAGTDGTTSASAERSTAAAGQASLGIMLASASQPWAIDGGIAYHRSGSDDNGFNLLEGHIGLQIRYGGSRAIPTEPVSYSQGLKALKEKDYAKAADSFGDALKANPQSHRAWHGLGNAVYMQSLTKKKEALKSWSKALALDPSNRKLATFVHDLKAMTDSATAMNTERQKLIDEYELSMLAEK